MKLLDQSAGPSLSLDQDTLYIDPLTATCAGIIGLVVLVAITLSCLCCSDRSSSDRRLSSYSSVKDTVQLEDLLSKPVLADPESVFSEPSIRGFQTNSESTKSPSADSDVRPSRYSYSPCETERFSYPSKAKPKSSLEDVRPRSPLSTDSSVPEGELMVTEPQADNRTDSVQSSAPKNTNSAIIDATSVGGQTTKGYLPQSKPLPKSRSKATDPSHTSQTISDQSSAKKTHDAAAHPSDYGEVLPGESQSILEIKTPGQQAALQDNALEVYRNTSLRSRQAKSDGNADSTIGSHKDSTARGNAHSDSEHEPEKSIDSVACKSTAHGDNNVEALKQLVKLEEYEQNEKNSTQENNADNSKSAKEKPKAIPLDTTLSFHPFIANPGLSRFREKVREKNLKACDPGSQRSILTPGRCSFSHEAGHTANGNTKVVSPLLNMSPIQERKLTHSNSSSPVTSPSPTASPKSFKVSDEKLNSCGSLERNQETLTANNQLPSCQQSTVSIGKGRMPLHIAATVDGSAPKLSASNIQANIFQTNIDMENKKDHSESVALRRPFSQDATEAKLHGRNIKTFSLNLKIDFHFENSEGTQTPDGIKSFTSTSKCSNSKKLRQENAQITSNVAALQKNACPDLDKNSGAVAKNNIATADELNNKAKILERCFAEKTSVTLTGKERKRRSEPVLVDKCGHDLEVPTVYIRRSTSISPRTRHTQTSHRRQERSRRSYAAGERLVGGRGMGQDVSPNACIDNTDNEDALDKGTEHKRRRIQSDTTSEVSQAHTLDKHQACPSVKPPMESSIGMVDDNQGRASSRAKPSTDTTQTRLTDSTTDTQPASKPLGSSKIAEAKAASTGELENTPGPQLLLVDGACKSETIRRYDNERSRTPPINTSLENRGNVTSGLPKSKSEPTILDRDTDVPYEVVAMKPTVALQKSDRNLRNNKETERQLHEDATCHKPDVTKPKPAPRGGTRVKEDFQPDSPLQQRSAPRARPRHSKPLEIDIAPVSYKSHTVPRTEIHGIASKENSPQKVAVAASSVVDIAVGDNKINPRKTSETLHEQLKFTPHRPGVGEETKSSQRPPTSANETSRSILRAKGKQDVSVKLKDNKTKSKEESSSKEPAPVLEVSDDSDYDNPWDSLDDAVQRASMRYNRRPSRIAAGADTKTLLLKSAEDLGRLMEEAEKRRRQRQAATKSSCPGEGPLLSPDSAQPTGIPFTRFSPLRHTVKGLVSQPLAVSTHSTEDLHGHSPVSSKSSAQTRSQSTRFHKHPAQHRLQGFGENSPEDETIEFRSRKLMSSSPPSRPKSLSAREVAKVFGPETKKRNH